jgi:uncharacterized protein (TIGR02246 family)
MNRVSSRCVALLLLALTGCQQGPPNETAASSAIPDDEAAVRQVVQRELAAGRANSADSFAVVFAADATVKPPNEKPFTGPALQAWFKDLFTNFTINQIEYSDEQITVSGDMAVHYYGFEWTVAPKGEQGIQEKGHGVHVLQRQADGSWKIAYDTWSTDTAPPPASGGH